MTPERIHHIGAVVRSMDDARAFFAGTLGLPFVTEETVVDQGVRAALFRLGDALLELLEPTVPDTGIARYLERKGEGLHHVCLEVPDLRAALDGLAAKDVELVDRDPRAGITGTIAFLHPNALRGVLVELVDAAGAAPLDGDGGAVRALDHAVIATDDMDATIDVWQHTFGLAAEPPYHPDDTHMQLAIVPVGPQGPFLELVRPTTPGHRVATFLQERGEGMFSISFRVDALDAAVDALRARGVELSGPEPGVFADTRVARIPRAAAHGIAIQLIERPSS